MSDITEWVKKRRRIHDATTGGPWAHVAKRFRSDVGHNVSSPETVVMFGGFESATPKAEADAVFVADVHNTLPALLTAVERVLAVCDNALAVKIEGSDEGDAAMAAMASVIRRTFDEEVADE